MQSSNRELSCADYHVAWICAVADLELLPARLMLDEEHPTPPYDTHYDENTYICGTIGGHAVVVATCPQGETGNVNAGRLTGSMFKTFPNIRMAVLVGIGGGIPCPNIPEDPLDDIHLGDVVVGWPGDGKPACVYHDRGRSMVDGQFEIVGTMQNPDWRLTNALGILMSDHELGRTKFSDQLARLQNHKKFARPRVEDRLFKAAYHHIGGRGSNCVTCDENELVQRPARTEESKNILVFHRGRIATGNSVIKDGELRDRISARCGGALCVEMEAAGVDVNRKCLVIRGVSDYADSHKNDAWRSHAAGNAAAFTRELLCRIQPDAVKKMEGLSEGPWLVPFPRPPSFAGRATELAQLSAHVSLEGSRRLAIYGLGGCGKTALALELSHYTRERQPTRAIFWVPAVDRESFEQAYRQIGMLLRIPGIADNKADVKQLVKARLSDEGLGQWLMIVDNADDVSVLLGVDRLIDYIPYSRKGSIVFTTRTRVAAIKLAESVLELGKLEKAEAKEILRKRLLQEHQHQLEDEEVTEKFLNVLAFLALAIVQAVAFINTNDIPLSDYLSLYRSSEEDATELLSTEFEDQGRYRVTKNPIATTWYISFEQIRKQNELAANYLSFMACTANNDIPVSMLPEEGSKIEQTQAFGTLKAYAFIAERQPQTDEQRGEPQGPPLKAFDVHPLVHIAMRGWLKAYNQWDLWIEKTLARLVKVIPDDDYDKREVWTPYLPHAMHIVDLPEACEAENRSSLWDIIGGCEWALGRYEAAEQTHRRALERKQRVLGKEHPGTLLSMNEVGLVLNAQGKNIEAEKMLRETVALRKKILGNEHPGTLMSMNNLAVALASLGKYIEAEQIYQETLALKEKVLGKEHPSTLLSMNNLAKALASLGKYIEAEQIYQETLALSEKVLGKEHPETLSTMNNLAETLASLGKYTEAEQIHQETLALKEKVLGKEHPDTLLSMNNLAGALASLGKYIEAEQIYQETLALKEKVLGKEHPDTLSSMNNLAGALSNQEKYVEAEHIFRESLALKGKVLGNEHPSTLMSVYWLAYTLREQHQYEDASTLYKRACTGFENTLGLDHPTTRQCLNGYSSLRQSLDERASANDRHGSTDGKSEHIQSITQGSSITELVSRPRKRQRRGL